MRSPRRPVLAPTDSGASVQSGGRGGLGWCVVRGGGPFTGFVRRRCLPVKIFVWEFSSFSLPEWQAALGVRPPR